MAALPKALGNESNASSSLIYENSNYRNRHNSNKSKSKYSSSKESKNYKNQESRLSNCDVWISPISDFKERINEASAILLTCNEVTVNAEGPSIPHAINLSLFLKSNFTVTEDVTTHTVYNKGFQNDGRKYATPAIKIKLKLSS